MTKFPKKFHNNVSITREMKFNYIITNQSNENISNVKYIYTPMTQKSTYVCILFDRFYEHKLRSKMKFKMKSMIFIDFGIPGYIKSKVYIFTVRVFRHWCSMIGRSPIERPILFPRANLPLFNAQNRRKFVLTDNRKVREKIYTVRRR